MVDTCISRLRFQVEIIGLNGQIPSQYTLLTHISKNLSSSE